MTVNFAPITAGDYQDGKIPDNFEEKLFEFFRDYLDENGNVKPGREENLRAYLYFIDRILPSVNYELNHYNAVARKNKRVSKCFTLTDEAFALACVQNYRQRWERYCLARESRKAARRGELVTPDGEVAAHEQPPNWFYARWSGSHLGNTLSGWTDEGISTFNGHCQTIAKLRADNSTGAALEDYIINHWKGTLKERKQRKRKQMIVDAFQEDHSFETKYAEV